MQDNKHYFVSFTVRIVGRFEELWLPAHGCIPIHPFEYIKSLGAPRDAILQDWKEISEEEYFLWDKLFTNGAIKQQWDQADGSQN